MLQGLCTACWPQNDRLVDRAQMAAVFHGHHTQAGKAKWCTAVFQASPQEVGRVWSQLFVVAEPRN